MELREKVSILCFESAESRYAFEDLLICEHHMFIHDKADSYSKLSLFSRMASYELELCRGLSSRLRVRSHWEHFGTGLSLSDAFVQAMTK